MPVLAFGMLGIEYAKQKVPIDLGRMRDAQERPLAMVKFIILLRARAEVLKCVPNRIRTVPPEPSCCSLDVTAAA